MILLYVNIHPCHTTNNDFFKTTILALSLHGGHFRLISYFKTLKNLSLNDDHLFPALLVAVMSSSSFQQII